MTRADVQGSGGTRDALLTSPASDFGGLPGGSVHSRLVQRLRRRFVDELPLLAPGVPTQTSMMTCLATLTARGHDTAAALRILRQLVVERLAVLDCEQAAPLQDVTQPMTWLAEVALDAACQAAFAQLDERHGAPIAETGRRAELWVIGMGKLGARELNVSSDIDLIYVYDADGETAGRDDGRGQITVQEYFTRAVKLIWGLIGDTTEHGFVFRVDLALRPNGNSGPTVCSLDALEEYMLVQGREWERFAWMKSRVVAPRAAIDSGSAQALRGVVLPFVFRKYLDYAVFESLRTLHQQIRDHAAKRSAGRPERANDVKLSRGGIREVEFIVQLLQVVRGGQFPELRTRPTLQALQRVAHAGLMPQDTAGRLAAAYVFLRRVEHRIQYLDDQQTHILPTDDDDLNWLARTLGYGSACPFLAELDTHREFVAQEFDRLLGGDAPCKNCQKGPNGEARAAPPEIEAVIATFPGRVREHLQAWPEHPRVLALRDEARGRLTRLLQRTAQWLEEGRVNEDGVLRLADWVEPLLRRESYIALLLERPSVHERLLRVLGAARWPARYVMQHPGVIDELASPSLLADRFDAAAFEQELERRRLALAATGEDDEENLLNLLRRAHHAEVFRTLVRDVEGRITVEQVADDLSALADAVLRLTTRWCWPRLRQRHRDEPRFGIIGYGKLGGKELGYGGDLDIVFVFDDEHDDAPEIYAAFVRKLITWLTVKTGDGDLFEIDTALRPNGSSGLLVTSIDAYADYQENRGSNTAWTWEHQAMTRARMIPPRCPAAAPEAAESGGLAARFDAVRHAVITAPRDHAALRGEIVAMRERMHAAHPVDGGLFDIKHSRGGMVDAEFATQYLVLAHTAQHPGLAPNLGNIALLQRAEEAGLLPAPVGQQAADAYRAMRRVQHRARLDEQPTQVAPETLAAERAAIERLWQVVFA
ncbi:bifunctional [glutamate--ammonia ligase]-adenylyl-L-tyrosine phosphorylase/[glutamate--ammonia-ligase] adenylyltransferase [Ottowia testudinis]|uniref:Bifunctional glutamine synthetase adenylyltransferase/adenylyl-removing enzyme n=1 Tax=Ottowia testudinis TaxID=2816950 RepID=A0A975CLC5_9BURK|nr:bifunctional [glutamate--ammonia ligase]-adenylyl-L-tyrosine phosphorylase/[glutamate--ammonia-ligase] adenylyltransferase [Ottowia testudinis]QTD45598.1 bifunctional [glutamate--ammonia ligase]-adenylyl-L-tyrosine phosphorylase/[glutamate--ammonia-ligase] adenylyltransferase [Ottowia testudinis]